MYLYSKIQLFCKVGYLPLNNPLFTVCQENHTWTTIEGCKWTNQYCDENPAAATTNAELYTVPTSFYGSLVSLKCIPGFSSNNKENRVVLRCDEDRHWTLISEACRPDKVQTALDLEQNWILFSISLAVSIIELILVVMLFILQKKSLRFKIFIKVISFSALIMSIIFLINLIIICISLIFIWIPEVIFILSKIIFFLTIFSLIVLLIVFLVMLTIQLRGG